MLRRLETMIGDYYRGRDARLAREAAGRRGTASELEFVSQTERFVYEGNMSRYDESRAVEDPNGFFLGECGMEVIIPFRGESGMASMMDVWLFDKEDIRTGTIVLVPDELSDKDPQKVVLLSRGKIYVAEEGGEIPLTLDSLRMTVKIVEVEFGIDPETDKRYFTKLVADVTVSQTNRE